MRYDYVYSVSMTPTDDTYLYDVYRFDGEHVEGVTLTLSDVRRMYPTCMNEGEALIWLNANAARAFSSE